MNLNESEHVPVHLSDSWRHQRSSSQPQSRPSVCQPLSTRCRRPETENQRVLKEYRRPELLYRVCWGIKAHYGRDTCCRAFTWDTGLVALSPGGLAAARYRAKLHKRSWMHPEVEKRCFMTVQKRSVFLYCIGHLKHHSTGHPSPPRWDQTGCTGCVTWVPVGLRYDKSNAWGEDVALTTWSSRAQQQFVSAWPVCGKAAVCFNCGNCIGGKRKQGVFQREQITHQLIWKSVLPK